MNGGIGDKTRVKAYSRYLLSFTARTYNNSTTYKTGATNRHTHTQTEMDPLGLLMGPPARRIVGLRVRVAGYLATSAQLDFPW